MAVVYETVIGLEVHAQLLTKSKVFCSCSTAFGGEPNRHTCPICLGMPGVLPVVNKKAVELAIKTALATHCVIASYSQFARKNYFYPDLPKGYQISQYEKPLASGGYLEIDVGEKGEKKKIGITRIHLEEDAGKLLHEMGGAITECSYVDFNRAGVPLMEIVSEPDISTPEEASEYLRSLREILQYLEVCDGSMEEGSFRCDANVSVRPQGQREFGTKVEIKNMNSFRHVQRALEYEAERQLTILRGGEGIIQETRLWDAEQGTTVSMRSKEEAHDYRYFPEPDISPLRLTNTQIEALKSKIPELPETKIINLKKMGLSDYQAEILIKSEKNIKTFEESLKISKKIKIKVNPSKIANLIINKKIDSPQKIIAILTTEKPTMSEQELLKIIDSVIKDNPSPVEEFKKGKETVIEFLVGQVMVKSRGLADPNQTREVMREKLKSS